MNLDPQFIKPFPSYEDVFYDDLDKHREHFLPICSINLKCIFPDLDEWVHFVSVKEIYEGCVGEDTQQFHTSFTKEDMIGFNVIDGKYKFEADWDYFIQNQEPQMVEEAYLNNEKDYQIRKEYFRQNNRIYPYSSFGKDLISAESLLRDFEEKQTSGWGLEYPEVNDILDDVAFMSDEAQEFIREYDESLEEMLKFENTNLFHVPKNLNGEVFKYVGSLTGYYFQAYGADCVYLFYDKELRKAAICFEYT